MATRPPFPRGDRLKNWTCRFPETNCFPSWTHKGWIEIKGPKNPNEIKGPKTRVFPVFGIKNTGYHGTAARPFCGPLISIHRLIFSNSDTLYI